jgi:hypothetical protein
MIWWQIAFRQQFATNFDRRAYSHTSGVGKLVLAWDVSEGIWEEQTLSCSYRDTNNTIYTDKRTHILASHHFIKTQLHSSMCQSFKGRVHGVHLINSSSKFNKMSHQLNFTSGNSFWWTLARMYQILFLKMTPLRVETCWGTTLIKLWRAHLINCTSKFNQMSHQLNFTSGDLFWLTCC